MTLAIEESSAFINLIVVPSTPAGSLLNNSGLGEVE